ncbi:MAG: DUF3231 family protein [Thermincola sp.]|jgi:spore coat protein CotF|nr:DUF3231 family protein [Thermincola sp.]MDT3702296.1 DUF3231 family protein [Thermincola sp.]
MKLLELYQKAVDLTKSCEEKQKEISISEVFHLSTHLKMRYDVLETTQILRNYAKSPDLLFILSQGEKVLQAQINSLEALMKEYNIPMPSRPPLNVNSTANFESITDRYIYRRVLKGIQTFIPFHASAYIQSTLPKVKERFKAFLLEEIDLQDKFLEYGNKKGFTFIPPRYRQ